MVKSGFAALSQGLLSETFLEAHRVVLINKTEDEELGENEEITEEELRQLQVISLELDQKLLREPFLPIDCQGSQEDRY